MNIKPRHVATGIKVGNIIFGAGKLELKTQLAINKWGLDTCQEPVWNDNGTQNPAYIFEGWGWHWLRRTVFVRHIATGKYTKWFSNGQSWIKEGVAHQG